MLLPETASMLVFEVGRRSHIGTNMLLVIHCQSLFGHLLDPQLKPIGAFFLTVL